ncbi:MAG: cyclase family protein [Pyrinomonadaceae bacterium]
MRIYDISVPITAAMPTYPGDPAVEIKQAQSLSAGDAANVTLLNFGAHTGTHVDAPAHFIEGASKVDMLSLDVLTGRARVVQISKEIRAISVEHLSRLDLGGATRILFRTRNSDFWSDASGGFREDFTYLEPEAARALARMGVRLVGIDYLSVEKFKSENFETHHALLSSGVVIIEGLDLREVAAGDYELICLPLKIAQGSGDGAPARAILRTMD